MRPRPWPLTLLFGAAANWRKKRVVAAATLSGERARIARDLHDDLGAVLSEIVMLADQAPLHRALPERLEEALSTIGEKARASLDALDLIVWAVNPAHDTLESLGAYTAAFAREYLGHAGIALRLKIAAPLPNCLLDAAVRQHLFRAIKEALYNAAHHSKAAEIALSMECAGGQLEISVADNGCGFSMEPLPAGNGLRNLRTRMEEIGGACKVHSTTNGGTRIVLTLPLPSLSPR